MNSFKKDRSKLPSKVEGFWNWFIKNQDRIKNISNDKSFVPKVIESIKNVHPTLSFEIGDNNQECEFIISCGGIKDGIKSVEKLVDSAPELDGFKFIKFRQARDEDLVIQIENVKISAKSILFDYSLDEKLNLKLYIPGYKKGDERFLHMAFILLDNSIGEYFVMTKIGGIDFLSINDIPKDKQLNNLTELKSLVMSKMN